MLGLTLVLSLSNILCLDSFESDCDVQKGHVIVSCHKEVFIDTTFLGMEVLRFFNLLRTVV